jgi:hypothetical protein
MYIDKASKILLFKSIKNKPENISGLFFTPLRRSTVLSFQDLTDLNPLIILANNQFNSLCKYIGIAVGDSSGCFIIVFKFNYKDAWI